MNSRDEREAAMYRWIRGEVARLERGQKFTINAMSAPSFDSTVAALSGVQSAPDISKREFDAKRLRRVVRLLGLDSAVPDSDGELLDCMGAVLGMVARKIEAQK